MFRINEGWFDRVVRVLIGAGLAVATFAAFTGVWQIIAGIVAAILLVTGLVGFCPLYRLLGITTHRTAGHTPNAGARA